MVASNFIAIKKKSDRMKHLTATVSSLKHSTLTAERMEMFAVENETSGNYIVDKRAVMVVHRIDIDRLRKEWLERAKTVQKPELLTEDGV